jgi:hypothetical protein
MDGGGLACAFRFDFGVSPTRLICIRAGGKEKQRLREGRRRKERYMDGGYMSA